MMLQLPLFSPAFWSVTDLTLHIRSLIENDPTLQDVWVQGEVSNLSRPASGHLYFTLKDSSSSLKCVMWRSSVQRMGFLPRDGQAIEVHGSLNVYEAQGQYQLYIDLIRPAGEGALYQEFLRLKARLEAEGLFDPQRKRPIPKWPQRIGIVTSPTGAALRDMLNTISRRYPLVEVILAPTAVQGEEAPPGIIAALEKLNRCAHPDVILVARGGGSIEDLWAFNNEQVVRAIAASEAPVISGIGHETDFTIADFISDLRAPTPTAAAELATPNRSDLQINLGDLIQRMGRSLHAIVASQHWELAKFEHRLAIKSPANRVRSDRQMIDDLSRRCSSVLGHKLQLQQLQLQSMKQQLIALNPLAILQRGYAIVQQHDGKLVRSIHQVHPGDPLDVRVQDGQFTVEVKE